MVLVVVAGDGDGSLTEKSAGLGNSEVRSAFYADC